MTSYQQSCCWLSYLRIIRFQHKHNGNYRFCVLSDGWHVTFPWIQIMAVRLNSYDISDISTESIWLQTRLRLPSFDQWLLWSCVIQNMDNIINLNNNTNTYDIWPFYCFHSSLKCSTLHLIDIWICHFKYPYFNKYALNIYFRENSLENVTVCLSYLGPHNPHAKGICGERNIFHQCLIAEIFVIDFDTQSVMNCH